MNIRAIYDDKELDEKATVNQQLTVQNEGGRKVSRTIDLYNLVMILAVGYRVRSVRGVRFRCYAQAEAMIAKNYLSEQELRVLNNLASAYFHLAELNAIEEREMRMADYVRELDAIVGSTGRNLLANAGSISHVQAETKAKLEYRKYKAKTLDKVEGEYLKTITLLEKRARTEGRKKGGEG